MKKYSSRRAKRGKTAYRTPSVFRYKKHQQVSGHRIKKKGTPRENS